MANLPDLRDHVRTVPAPPEATVIVRGGPNSPAKLRTHAKRVQRAFVLDGAPVLGISVFAALDDLGAASRDGILGGRLSTYRVVHLVLVEDVSRAGFTLLPTFMRPHMTLLLDSLEGVDALLAVLGPPEPNPRYGEMRRRTERRPRL